MIQLENEKISARWSSSTPAMKYRKISQPEYRKSEDCFPVFKAAIMLAPCLGCTINPWWNPALLKCLAHLRLTDSILHFLY